MSADLLGSLGAQTTSSQVREGQLLQSATRLARDSDGPRIEKGAKEFESVLLDNWLEQAEQSFATVPGVDDDQSPGQEQMMSLGAQSLAGAITADGGLGIARMIAAAMKKLEIEQIKAESQAGKPEAK